MILYVCDVKLYVRGVKMYVRGVKLCRRDMFFACACRDEPVWEWGGRRFCSAFLCFFSNVKNAVKKKINSTMYCKVPMFCILLCRGGISGRYSAARNPREAARCAQQEMLKPRDWCVPMAGVCFGLQFGQPKSEREFF